jgi:hypothetical protein
VGHLGGSEIAFIRDGRLWTIDPSGANAFAVASENTPIVGYSWSPTHQVLAYRSLDADFARTPAARRLASTPQGDLPATLNTIGIDGGSPIPIAFSSSSILYSNPIWNATGTRLLYRQEARVPSPTPTGATWWVSQNDQPAGIAAKSLPVSYSIPSVMEPMTIGNFREGVFTTTLAGTAKRWLTGPLPGHPLPAALERILWQPAHAQPGILYAVASSPVASGDATTVQLLLRASNGHTTQLTTCHCDQFAWSPDGNSLLYHAGSAYTILNIKHNAAFSISAEPGSVPYWSPNAQFLLLDGPHTLQFIDTSTRHSTLLLSDNTSAPVPPAPAQPGTQALLQPVANSIWSADGTHFLFLTHGRLSWRGQRLSHGNALYQVALDAHGQVQGAPSLVDAGNDSQAGWSYEDANTSFLY